MNQRGRTCFVIMPFAPELHYFYLYVKQYLELKHRILCERADAQVWTRPILEKIVDYIRNSDVVIADISGRNPNVFYELGLAHAYEKDVVLITKDPVQEVPSDIRHFEFIPYSLDRHVEFLERLDNALRNVFAGRYESLYYHALTVFAEFKQATSILISPTSKDIFMARVMAAEPTQGLPPLEDQDRVAEFVLLKIIPDNTDYTLVNLIMTWLSTRTI